MEKAQSLDERGLKGQRSVMKWQSMKVVNLVNHCKERGLTSTGSRAVLIQRLYDYENGTDTQKTALLKSSDIESNTDDDFEIEEVSVDGHDMANDSGCPTSDNEDIHYRLKKSSSPIKPNTGEVNGKLELPETTLDSDFLSEKRISHIVASETSSTTRSQLRAALSIDNHLDSDDGFETRSIGCTGCETVSNSVSSLKKEMAKLWRRHSADSHVRPVMASLLPVSNNSGAGNFQSLRTENDRLKAQNIKLLREVATLRRELDETHGDKDSLVRIVCLLAKDKTSTISSQEFEIMENK